MDIVAKNIKKIRKSKGMSQNDLAKALDRNGFPTNKNRISDIEQNKTDTKDIEIYYISNIFNVSINELFADIT